jgi:hypothetical protein
VNPAPLTPGDLIHFAQTARRIALLLLLGVRLDTQWPHLTVSGIK